MIIEKTLLAESFARIFDGIDAGKSRAEIWDSLPDFHQQTITKLMSEFSPEWFKGYPVMRGLLSHNRAKQIDAVAEVACKAPKEQAVVLDRLKNYLIQFADRTEAHDSFAEMITIGIQGSDKAYAEALMDCDVAKVPPHIAYPIGWLATDLLEPILDKYATTDTRIGVVARNIKEAKDGRK